jgi:hypothetical protein
MNFPDSPSGGDLFNGFIYNATLGVWDVATSDGYFAVTASGSSAYVFNGFGTDSDSNPTLYLHRGKTYEFAVDATGHPFYIKTVSGTGTGNAYSDGVTNNGTASGTIKFVVPQDAPSKLYYNCSAHGAMAGEIIIPRAAQIDDLSDVDTSTTAPTDGQVLTWDNANSQWEPATASGGIALTDLSVTTNTAGTAALSYSNSTGVFSYTPPDLSSYLTSYTVTQSDVTTHQAALSITESQISDLGTYLTGITNESIGDLSDVNSSITGSGNHVLGWDATNSRWDAQVGITPNNVNSYVDFHLNQSSAATNEVLSWNGSDYDWVAQSGGIALTDISVTTNAAGTAALSYNNTTGTFSYTPPDLSSYLTGISSQSIGDLSDVNSSITGATNYVLGWDAGNSRWDATNIGTYIHDQVDNHLNTSVAPQYGVLFWNGTDYAWTTSYISRQDLSVTTNSAGTAALSYSNSTGVFTYTPPDLSSYLTSVALDDVSDVTITSASNGQVLKYNGTAWVNAADAGGIALTDLSVTTNAAGTAALSYNNSTGAFSYTPPDLSSYLTSYTVTQSDVTTHQAALSITESQISDLGSYLTGISGEAIGALSDVTITSASSGQVLKYNGTAWINSIDSTYSDSAVDTHLNTGTASSNQVLSWTGSDYDWVAQGIALTDISVTTNSAGTAALSYNNSTGAFTYTPPDLSSYLTGISGQSIEDLSDVNAMTPTDGQVLTWDNANSRWDAVSPSGGSYNNSSVDSHLNTSTASANQVLSWTGSDYDWVNQSGGSGGGSSVTVSETAPSSPSSGDLWFDPNALKTYVYYNDGDSNQWVQANPTGGGSGALVVSKNVALNFFFGS